MLKVESLVALIQSLNKTEKRQFATSFNKRDLSKDYMVVYNIIERDKKFNQEEIRNDFLNKIPNGSFHTAVTYLYEKLLDLLLHSYKKNDSFIALFYKILEAKILYERSMFRESLELLSNIIVEAEKMENYNALLLAYRMELDFLLRFNYLNISEQELFHKQYAIINTLKIIGKINEESSLYELLKHRLIYKGNIRSNKQRKEMNDLLISELSIVVSSKSDNFEITKMHQLFQAYYLISAGDYNAALQSFKELIVLFESNSHLWANPPFYYLSTIEGILVSLRSIGNYKDMDFFKEKLRNLKEHFSIDFRVEVICLLYEYELFPLLDSGNFDDCIILMKKYKEILYDRYLYLRPLRHTELFLYTSLIYLGNKQFKQAKKYINDITFDRNLGDVPISRTVRLIRLVLYYEEGDYEIIPYEIRSFKRKYFKNNKHGFKVERLILWFVNHGSVPLFKQKRDKIWTHIKPKIDALCNDKYEMPVLGIFDFTSWVEAKILKKNLSEILKKNFIHKV